jgi:hypothetical protein
MWPPSSIRTEILDAYRATLTAQVGAPTTDITKDNLSKKRWCANLGDETEKKVCEEGKIRRMYKLYKLGRKAARGGTGGGTAVQPYSCTPTRPVYSGWGRVVVTI